MTLTACSVEGVREDILRVHLKCPKEDKLRKGVMVELFGTGTVTCPIAAWRKYHAVSKVAGSRVGPLFRLHTGECYTGNQFNKDVKNMLGQHVDYNERKYLSHSFRAGLANMMAAAGTVVSKTNFLESKVMGVSII